jgi:hypothetical protein
MTKGEARLVGARARRAVWRGLKARRGQIEARKSADSRKRKGSRRVVAMRGERRRGVVRRGEGSTGSEPRQGEESRCDESRREARARVDVGRGEERARG